MAVKDTCITPVFHGTENNYVDRNGDEAPNFNGSKKKRKKRKIVDVVTTSMVGDEELNGAPNNKRQCTDVGSDKNSEGNKEEVKNTTTTSSDGHTNNINESNNTMKPRGYSFSLQSHDILPGYHSITVPTFDLVDDVTNFARKNNARKNSGKQTKNNTTNSNTSKKLNRSQPTTLPSVPATNSHVTLCTPHGMQKLDVDSYTQIVMDTQSESVIGLFDQAHASDKKKRKINCMERNKSWTEQLVKKNTSSCSNHSDNNCDNKAREKRNIWAPFICDLATGEDDAEDNNHNGNNGNNSGSEGGGNAHFVIPFDEKFQSTICHQENIIGLAMVGLHHIPSRKGRINLLQRCSKSLEQINASTFSSLDFAVLVTKNLRQILDVTKCGVNLFGCDLPSQWARSGKALALSISRNEEDGNGVANGMDLTLDEDGCIDLSCDRYCRDKRPLLVGCQCPSCRNDTYSRAYVHHLIKANELLGDILLFGHNLYQMLLLCKEFSTACTNGTIDPYCEFIENQLT
eukprot:CAMPEP_0203677388 /NCGR_PEP_ID=MMETSP0090-20130426/28033_1 /ASSEMBLY_ACC=CAM_ASM_001088 /TAXON_ID=426623 /ORGANISM="Chaetoceros affinis, Strain CCMP159" /LENGTH=514 /DNA_ID=CAMNT_0050544269 /DNA_START=93 /DNA_END=1637 /DNA_ORIENTATION=+